MIKSCFVFILYIYLSINIKQTYHLNNWLKEDKVDLVCRQTCVRWITELDLNGGIRLARFVSVSHIWTQDIENADCWKIESDCRKLLYPPKSLYFTYLYTLRSDCGV